MTLQALEQPPGTFGSTPDIFQQALGHEKKVSGLLRNLVDLATRENDYATQNLLPWFINEQVEEEKNATQIVEQLKMIGQQGAALFMMDAQLGRRAAGD